MSDNWIQLIPTNPEYRPSRWSAFWAKRTLVSYFSDCDEVTAKFTSSINFFDAGSNWDGVKCPRCGEDAEEWWWNRFEQAAVSNFTDLYAITSCCGAGVSLNDMAFVRPVGFGQFVLEAMNPNKDLLPAQLQTLSRRLGCTQCR